VGRGATEGGGEPAGGDPSPSRAEWMREAIRLSRTGCAAGEGGPFGAVVVEAATGRIAGRGWNRVLITNDPTAHAEVVAIREACRSLGRFHLDGCELYTSCEPCPMCLGAIHWARIDRVYFAAGRADAARIGFQDDDLYREIAAPLDRRRIPLVPLLGEEARAVMEEWGRAPGRRLY
jgi:guanine deaminase